MQNKLKDKFSGFSFMWNINQNKLKIQRTVLIRLGGEGQGIGGEERESQYNRNIAVSLMVGIVDLTYI